MKLFHVSESVGGGATREEKGCCTRWPAGGVTAAEGATHVSEF